jgi:septum site-determining protein MinD
MGTQICTVLGAAGGVGTTRLAVECGATLARTGRDVAVVDAAFETQGLAGYVTDEISPDVTTLVTEQVPLESALYEHDAEVPGEFVLCPARAPFERFSQAKTAGGAKQLERQLAAAALSYDVVLVDTPPLGTNQALAAVNAADRVGVVTVDSRRGADALARTRGVLSDVGDSADAVIANRGGASLVDADASVPESEVGRPGECPACLRSEGAFAPAVAEAAGALLGTSLDLNLSEEQRMGGLLS